MPQSKDLPSMSKNTNAAQISAYQQGLWPAANELNIKTTTKTKTVQSSKSLCHKQKALVCDEHTEMSWSGTSERCGGRYKARTD